MALILYRAAVNHDVALGSLTTFSPQPRGGMVRPTRRHFLGQGVQDEGLWCEFLWSSLRNITQFQTILTVNGLSDTILSANVTIYTIDRGGTAARYNATAILPEYGADWDYLSFPRNLRILYRNLEKL